jgi:hypothetical protein
MDLLANPLASDFAGLDYFTLGGDFTDRNASILAANSVRASGFSLGGPDNRVTGYDVKQLYTNKKSPYGSRALAVCIW